MMEEESTSIPVCPYCGAEEYTFSETSFCPTCMMESTKGRSLGRAGPYTLESVIGEGGMGKVFLAFHDRTGRAVALKVPRASGVERKSFHQRFIQEARALSSLDHPGILPIYEVGEENGEPWFAMKLAEGGTLADRLVAGPLPIREGVEIVASVAGAAQYAHDRGILHRDLKPHNILLDEHSLPMLGDFGLARWEGSGPEMSLTISVLGSPDYAAPEMTQGRAPSASADIFSLGAILYHVLSGVPPFQSETLAGTLTLAAEGNPEPLTRRGIPADLWRICRKCLEAEPTDRYASAGAFEQDLRAWLDGRPLSVQRMTPAAKLRRVVRRNPLITALSLTTALALSLALIIALVANRRLLISERLQDQTMTQLQSEKLHAERLAYAELLLGSGRAGKRQETLDLVAKEWQKSPRPVLRNLAIRAMALGDLTIVGPPLRYEPVFSEARRPKKLVSTGSKRVARLISADERQVRIESATGEVETTILLDDRLTAMEWNAKGDLLALGCSAKGTYLWRAGSANVERHVRRRDSATIRFIWRPDDQYVACITGEGDLSIWSLGFADDIISEQLSLSYDDSPKWSDDGQSISWSDVYGVKRTVQITYPVGIRMLKMPESLERRENFRTLALNAEKGLALWVAGTGAFIWDYQKGTYGKVVAKSGAEWLGARFVKDGIQTCGWNSGLRGLTLDQLKTGQTLQEVPGSAPYVGAVLLSSSSENDWLALLERPANRFILLDSANLKHRINVKQAEPYSVALNADATLAATSSFQHPNVKVWKLPGSKLLHELPVDEVASFLTLSPDGKTLAVISSHRSSLWDVTTGKERLVMGTDETNGMAAWSPDGKIIAIQNDNGTHLFKAADGTFLAALKNPAPRSGEQHVTLACDKNVPLFGEQLSEGSLILWDLAEISRKLQELGMAW